MTEKTKGSNKFLSLFVVGAVLGLLFLEVTSVEEQTVTCSLNANGYQPANISVILEEYSPLVNLWAEGNRAAKMNGDFGPFFFSTADTRYNKSYKIFSLYNYDGQPYLELDLLQNKAVLIYGAKGGNVTFRGFCNRF